MIAKRRTRSGEVRYDVRYRGTDGKERSRTFRTRKEAERYERAQHTAIDQGVWVDPRSGRVTLRSWAVEWQRTVVHLRPATQRIYDANLRCATTSCRRSVTSNWGNSRLPRCERG